MEMYEGGEQLPERNISIGTAMRYLINRKVLQSLKQACKASQKVSNKNLNQCRRILLLFTCVIQCPPRTLVK